MTQKEQTVESPWVSYYPFDDLLFIPRTSRRRLSRDPVETVWLSGRCSYEGQGAAPRWTNLEGKLVGNDELHDLIGDDLAKVRKEHLGEWMKRIVARVRHLKLTAPGRVPFEWLAIGDRFKYCGSWGTKKTTNRAEQDHHGVVTDFEPDDMVWRPEA